MFIGVLLKANEKQIYFVYFRTINVHIQHRQRVSGEKSHMSYHLLCRDENDEWV